MDFLFTKVLIIYNIMLISGVQYSDSAFLQIILNRLLQVVDITPCAIQYVFVTYLFYIQ